MIDNEQNNTCKIADFRERVQILQSQQVSDNVGGYAENKIVQKTIWASIRMIDSTAPNNQLRQENLAHYEICCRYLPITPDQKIIFRGKEATVKSITELDNKKKFISFIAIVLIN